MESRLADGQLLLEFELIPRRKAGADFSMAAHPDNLTRNQYVERMTVGCIILNLMIDC